MKQLLRKLSLYAKDNAVASLFIGLWQLVRSSAMINNCEARDIRNLNSQSQIFQELAERSNCMQFHVS